MKVLEVVRDGKHEAWAVRCPACNLHVYDSRWTFNGDVDNPTFTASYLAVSADENGPTRCHSHTTNGVLEFGPDCTHQWAGQKIPLKDEP